MNAIARNIKLSYLAKMFALIAILVAPVYLFMEARIQRGVDVSEIAYVTNIIHGGRTYSQRLLNSIDLINAGFSLLVVKIRQLPFGSRISDNSLLMKTGFFGAIGIGVLLSLFHKTWRWITLLIIVPFFFLWAFFYSYDLRNLSLTLPFIAAASGIGMESLARHALKNGRYLYSCTIMKMLVPALIVLFIANQRYDRNYLINRQVLLQKKIGDRDINDALYDYHKKSEFKGVTVTNYQFMKFLPGLEQYYFLDHMNDQVGLLRNICISDAKHILALHWLTSSDVKKILQERASSGQLKQLPSPSNVSFFEIVESFCEGGK